MWILPYLAIITIYVVVLIGLVFGAELLARVLDEKLTKWFKEKNNGRKQDEKMDSSRRRNKKSKTRDI